MSKLCTNSVLIMGNFLAPFKRNHRPMFFRVMNDFVERQETGLVGMEDEGSSIDLESEDECQSLDDEEEDTDE